MCGIACLLGAPEDRKLVDAMLERIEHRGREGRYTGDYSDGRAVLGMNRLALVSVSDGDQPTHNCANTIHSVCNGMIYNHVSVRDREGPTNFPSKTDVGVIPFLYQKYGDDCVHRLDGTYAFVVYDERKQRFLAARDPFGVKPLYYIYQDGRWYFASEVKAFLVAGLHCDVQNVRIVLPGHYISCSLAAGVDATPEQVPFYRLDVTKPVVPSTDHLYSLIDTAVKRKMLADGEVPIGVCLSGGIDSSIIAALACRHSNALQAFTIGVEGSTDTEYAKLMAKHLNLPLHIRTFTFPEIEKNLERAIYHLESYSPLLIVEGVMLMMLSELAASKNIKVLLAGTGADEIFAGYGVFRKKTPDEMADIGKRLLLNLHMTENRLSDKTAMAHCVDSREPFLDPSVVEYAMRLPPSALIHTGRDGRPVEKWILREAFGHLLPDVIRDRMKMAMDDGSGILAMIKGLEQTVTDEELAAVKREEPEARVHDKIHLYCYKIWRRLFGKAGGKQRFPQFCEYPVLAESWSDAGGTGEDAEDLKLLSAERMPTDHKQSSSGSATLVPSSSSSNGNGTCTNGTCTNGTNGSNGFASPPRAKKQKVDGAATNGNHSNGNGTTSHNGHGNGADHNGDADDANGDGDFTPRRKASRKPSFTAAEVAI